MHPKLTCISVRKCFKKHKAKNGLKLVFFWLENSAQKTKSRWTSLPQRKKISIKTFSNIIQFFAEIYENSCNGKMKISVTHKMKLAITKKKWNRHPHKPSFTWIYFVFPSDICIRMRNRCSEENLGNLCWDLNYYSPYK